MSLISKDKIIADCADGYRTATGTTDAIKVSELGSKISSLFPSGGSNFIEFLKIKSETLPSKAFQNCSTLQKVWISKNCLTISASTASDAPFDGTSSGIAIYTDASASLAGWDEYYNYVNGRHLTVNFGVSESDFEAICYGNSTENHYYKFTTSLIPGKSYLITDGSYDSSNVAVLQCADNITEGGSLSSTNSDTIEAASVYDQRTINKFVGDENCEWICVRGTPVGTNTEYATPETYMFQNKKTGAWLYNPVYDSGNGSNMSVTFDPLTDNYSPFSRQVYRAAIAVNSYYQSNNHGGVVSYSPSEPSWVRITTSDFSSTSASLNDPWVKFNFASQQKFSDLVLTYYTMNTVGGTLDLFAFVDSGFMQTSLGSTLAPEWRSYVFSDSAGTSLSGKVLQGYRLDLNLKGGVVLVSSAILARNIYARISIQAYARNSAKYKGSLTYPSHRYPFCQFASPSVTTDSISGTGVSFSHISKVSNFDSSDGTTYYPEQYSYGWVNGVFCRSWNNATTSAAFQLWERVDEESDIYEYVPVSSEDEIVNGETYILSSTNDSLSSVLLSETSSGKIGTASVDTIQSATDNCKMKVVRVGDYFYLSTYYGNNLICNESAVLSSIRGAVAEIETMFKWKYDFKNHRLVAYSNPQNAGESLKYTNVGLSDGAISTTGNIYMFRRQLKNPNNTKIITIV